MIVSFYTPDYADAAARLRKSLGQFGLPAHIVKVPSAGSWHRNVIQKPTFLIQQLEQHGEVIWLDADAELLQRPDELLDAVVTHDLVLPQFPAFYGTVLGAYSTAVIGLSDHITTWMFLAAWEALAKYGAPRYAGDMEWANEVLKLHPNLDLHILPETYLQIFDATPIPGAIVKHYQGSRAARRRSALPS